MNVELRFLFLLGALICFGLAAAGGRFSTRVGLVPLGLALFIFPAVWDTGVAAF